MEIKVLKPYQRLLKLFNEIKINPNKYLNVDYEVFMPSILDKTLIPKLGIVQNISVFKCNDII